MDALAYRRRLALVLQAPLLIRASVIQNVALGMRYHGLPRAEVFARAALWMERLKIRHLAERRADRLSGGEAQRVSLARAFALEPELLLLDEPFSALDAPTRYALLADFAALVEEFALTAILVTHDLDAARALGDEVAVLIDGRLRQVADPETVFEQPASREVASFIGMENLLPGRVVARRGEWLDLRLEVDGVRLRARGAFAPGEQVWVGIRPEHVLLVARDMPAPEENALRGVVRQVIPQGAMLRLVIQGAFSLAALLSRPQARGLGVRSGLALTAVLPADAVWLLPRTP